MSSDVDTLEQHASTSASASNGQGDHAIAIVGMTGRFPGAPNLDAFWRNLQAGTEARTIFSDDELRAAGVPSAMLSHPNFVQSGFVLDGIDRFDAAFFGINPREAELLDPQHRLFLECAWEALEDAGYDPDTFPGPIAVFGGATLSGYLTSNVYRNPALVKSVGGRQAVFGSVPDYMVTRVAYKLNLRGPRYSVQTACSTSLVAVHIGVPEPSQPRVRHGARRRRVGRRPASHRLRVRGRRHDVARRRLPGLRRQARGTVFGSGVGIVVLKRLADAMADGDTIQRSSEARRPTTTGRSRSVHGAGRGRARRRSSPTRWRMPACLPKHQLRRSARHGHRARRSDRDRGADACVSREHRAQAALRHRIGEAERRPSRCRGGRQQPDQDDDGAASTGSCRRRSTSSDRIRRSTSRTARSSSTRRSRRGRPSGTPRRAGVSSFGFGGTNAHVILEEAPARGPRRRRAASSCCVLSARTPNGARERQPSSGRTPRARTAEADLADVAYTLAVGRRAFAHRRAVVCAATSTRRSTRLSGRDSGRVFTGEAARKDAAGRLHVPGPGLPVRRHGRWICIATSRSSGRSWTSAPRTCASHWVSIFATCSFRRTVRGRRSGRTAQADAAHAVGVVRHRVRAGPAVDVLGHCPAGDDRPQRRRVRGGLRVRAC